MGDANFEALLPPTGHGRVFTVDKKSRIQDITVDGRIRLDAIARIVSEVSEDDLVDLDRPNTRWWMARRITMVVRQEGVGLQQYSCQTWAGSMARVAAERRVTLVSAEGLAYDTATTWISIDPESGRPVALPHWFKEEYSEACGTSQTTVRATHGPVVENADEVLWGLRRVDFDQHGHVNNRAYWPVVEEMMARYDFDRNRRYRVEVEFRSGVPVAPSVTLRVEHRISGISIWWVVDDQVAASATVDYLD